MKYIVPKQMTLLEALSLAFPDPSKTTLRLWLKKKMITVDGKVINIANTPVLKGQVIKLLPREKILEKGLKILYKDEHIVVVDKPNGLLSVATLFEQAQTAHAILKEFFRPKRVYVVHRLDQDTSGVMLFALSKGALTKLKRLFETHTIIRRYFAVVNGHLEKSSGTWQSYLFEDKNYVVHETADPSKGQLAITHYRVVKTTPKHSFLEMTLETGKKNQIRVHCQSAGVPIVGDQKYGLSKERIKKRLMLHASFLSFTHPMTKKNMQFFSDRPDFF